MLRITRVFLVVAAVSSSVLCAPISQDNRKSMSTGQASDPLAPASNVFGTTPQVSNYQTHPTGLCIVPALAKDAGLSQTQEQVTVQQAIQLCPEATTIAVSSKNLKRNTKAPNDYTPLHPAPGPQPSPVPGGHPIAARSQSESHPSPKPSPQPNAPRPVVARLVPKAEPLPHGQPLPATLPRPSHLF